MANSVYEETYHQCERFSTFIYERKRKVNDSETNLDALDLKKATRVKLARIGLTTIEELLGLSNKELCAIENIGKGSFDEIVSKVNMYLHIKGIKRNFPRRENEYDPLRSPYNPFLETLENIGLNKAICEILHNNGFKNIGEIMVLSKEELKEICPKHYLLVISKIRSAFVENRCDYEFPQNSICRIIQKDEVEDHFIDNDDACFSECEN